MGKTISHNFNLLDPELSRLRTLDEDYKIKHAVQGVEFRF